MRYRPRRRAATILEILFGMVIFGMILTMLARNLRFANLSAKLQDRLDVLQRLRLAELRVRDALQTGTSILYPPPEDLTAPSGDPRTALVFTGPFNGLRVVYLDSDGVLKLQSRVLDAAGDVQREQVDLAKGIATFEVRHPLPGQAECRVAADSDEHGRVSVVFSGHVGNNFLGEGEPP